VYEIASKNDAIAELGRRGLSTVALEQKCLQQQFNVVLEPSRIKEEIAAWEQTLIDKLDDLNSIRIETLADITLGNFSRPTWK
jgi:hypothetical protein